MKGLPAIDRRRCLTALAGGLGGSLLGSSTSARAAQPLERPFRIGCLSLGGVNWEAIHAPPFPPHFMAEPTGRFIAGLHELGYEDGRDFTCELRSARSVVDRLPALAADLVQWPMDLIVASTRAPALAAMQATKTIPIVALAVPDPVAYGLIASLAHPGGNVTGVAYTAGDLFGRMLQTLKEAVPGLSRIGLLLSTADPIRKGAFARSEELGLTPVSGDDVARSEDIAPALAELLRQKAEAFVVMLGPIGYVHRKEISDFALAHRLPGICSMSAFADAGLLMAFGSDVGELHRRGAAYADKILRGAKPADLPMELPTKFDVVINLRSARALGLAIPSALQLRADRLIE